MLLVTATSSTLVGCAGHASVHAVAIDNQKLSLTGPLVVRIKPNECYWWVNENTELCVAMRSKTRSLLGRKFDREFVLSFVLDGVPAGPARRYRVDRRTVRVRYDAGLSHTRAASTNGQVAVWNYGQDKLKGRFSCAARQQSYSALVGWGQERTVMFVGDFTALPNPERSAIILARTEEGAMIRPPPSRRRPFPIKGPSPGKDADVP